MSGLGDIPVRVEPPGADTAEGRGEDDLLLGGVTALLAELCGLLERLAETGETGAIDLRSLPMAPGEHEYLRERLGHGEVTATLDAFGPTRIYECAIPGVWWIQHHNADGEVLAEIIEVTRLPAILMSDPGEIHDGAARLRAQLNEPKDPTMGGGDGGSDPG